MVRQLELYEQPVEELLFRLQTPLWTEPMFEHHRFKVSWGGRAGGKTHGFARAFLTLGMKNTVRMICVRETFEAVMLGSRQILVDLIYDYNLDRRRVGNVMKGFWSVYKNVLVGANGTHIYFLGLSDRTKNRMRSVERVNYLWYDEAQQMSHDTAEGLYPSVRGKPFSELWFSFNPRYWSDPVCRDFMRDTRRRQRAFVQEVQYYHNPWLPTEMEEERVDMLEDQPERYNHVWNGVPDEEGDRQKVLPESYLRTMFEMWDRRGNASELYEGRFYGGLDVADSELGRNSQTIRQGGIVHDIMVRTGEIEKVAPWVNRQCRRWNIGREYFDGGGLGSGMRISLRGLDPKGYSILPVMFGEEPAGPDTLFSFNLTNKQFFSRRNIQMAWNVRLRLLNTISLSRGRDVDPRKCLFVNPNIRHKEHIIKVLSQPEWYEKDDMLYLEKQPDKGDPSPDEFDSICLAFHRDIEGGLVEADYRRH